MYKIRSILRFNLLNILSIFAKPKHGLHILNGHFLSLNDNAKSIVLDNLIYSLSKKGVEFIDFEKVVRLISEKKIPEKKCFVAFTFDDGFKECFTKIKPVLDKYNLKAAFFINPGFIDGDIKYKNNFKNNVVLTDKEPMNWQEIKILANENHTIGSHTIDHVNIAESSTEIIEYQLKECKNILENKLNINCEHFAFPFGKLDHFSEQGLEISKKYYKYIYSQSDYQNYFSFEGHVINRRHFECDWPYKHVLYFLKKKKYNGTPS